MPSFDESISFVRTLPLILKCVLYAILVISSWWILWGKGQVGSRSSVSPGQQSSKVTINSPIQASNVTQFNAPGSTLNFTSPTQSKVIVQPGFAIVWKSAIIEANPDTAVLWVLERDTLLYPANVVAFVQFTNLRLESGVIDSYSIEIESEPEHWQRVESIDVRHASVFFIDDPKQAIELDFAGQDFNSLIRSKVSLNDTIQGWLFLNSPIRCDKRLRMQVRDASG